MNQFRSRQLHGVADSYGACRIHSDSTAEITGRVPAIRRPAHAKRDLTCSARKRVSSPETYGEGGIALRGPELLLKGRVCVGEERFGDPS
jgi:hypothetical protein